MTATKFYTGVGSRETPESVCTEMTRMACQLRLEGWTLRSGGADGADWAFERGAENDKNIFLPWPMFNGHRVGTVIPNPSNEATALAAKFHPRWRALSDAAKKLHVRNGYAVLGATLDAPSAFVLCWTAGGKGAGGTGQALRIARAYGIPVYDLGGPDEVTVEGILNDIEVKEP